MLSSPFGLAMCLLTFTMKGVLTSARLLSSNVLGRVCVLEQSYAAYCLATGQVPQATLRATPSVLCKRRAQTTLQLHCAASRFGKCVSACAGWPACGCKQTVLGIARFRFSKYSFNHAFPQPTGLRSVESQMDSTEPVAVPVAHSMSNILLYQMLTKQSTWTKQKPRSQKHCNVQRCSRR